MTTISRRSMLRGVGLATLAAATMPSLPTFARPAPVGGCCQLCARAGASAGLSSHVFSSGRSLPTVIHSTGDVEADHFLGQALARLATTFEVNPGFGFFDEGKGIDAFATDRRIGAPDTSGSVLFGTHLFRQAMALEGDHGLSVIAICAHEFGHIHQMQQGYFAKFQEMDHKTVRPSELHADFLAGFYLAQRKKEHPDFNLQNVGHVFFVLGDTAFNDANHHGTPEERVEAITGGYKAGKTMHTISEASAAGMTFVQRMI